MANVSMDFEYTTHVQVEQDYYEVNVCEDFEIVLHDQNGNEIPCEAENDRGTRIIVTANVESGAANNVDVYLTTANGSTGGRLVASVLDSDNDRRVDPIDAIRILAPIIGTQEVELLAELRPQLIAELLSVLLRKINAKPDASQVAA